MAASTPLPPAAAPAERGAARTPARQARRRSCYRASALTGLLLAVAAGVGLFVPSLYQGNTAFAATAFRGTDLVSLAVALPVLAGALWLASRGSRRALLLWLGTLAYVAYTYLYSFAIAWNRLFLVYVALLSLSLLTLARALTVLDANELAARFGDRTPVRGVGAFLWVVGGMLGLIELAQVVPRWSPARSPTSCSRRGTRPGSSTSSTSGWWSPSCSWRAAGCDSAALGGMWRRRSCSSRVSPWAWRCCRPTLVGSLDDGRTDGPLLGLWALVAVGSLLVLVRYLQPMHDRPVGRAADPTAG